MDEDDANIPTISIASPSGPVIHDVTDLMEEVSSAELTEVPQEERTSVALSKESPLISEEFAPSEQLTFTELPFKTEETACTVSLQPEFQEE